MGRLGIIGAMRSEVALLIERMEVREVSRLIGIDYTVGVLEGCDVVVCQCGIGKVNAGVCAAVMIGAFGVDAVINTGVAGSLKATLDIGDLVVATDAIQHDLDVTALGYELGFIPNEEVLAFESSKALRDALTAAASEVAPDIHVVEGRIASGDQFVASAEHKDRIIEHFDAACCEMEGAAIAQVCYKADVPFCVVRAISDKADGSASLDYPTFQAKAAKDCAAIVCRMAATLWA